MSNQSELGIHAPWVLDAEGIEKLRDKVTSLGYMVASKIAPVKRGVVLNQRNRTYSGYNAYSSASHPEVILMDMDGKVIHSWTGNLLDSFPKASAHHPFETHKVITGFHIYENGDLLAIFSGHGIVKLDRNSFIQWAYEDTVHHFLDVDDDGTIYTLTRRQVRRPDLSSADLVWDDLITVLSPEGVPIRNVSIIKAIENSVYYPALQNVLVGEREGCFPPKDGDLLHGNSVEILDGRLAKYSPAFAQGNILISLRDLDMVGIIDMKSEKLAWALTAMWARQHRPTMLDNGHLMVFDNRGNHEKSRVLEIDPFSQEVHWEYTGSDEFPFESEVVGSAQRLPNGNTLMSVYDMGEAIEVTMEKDVVWRFVNPFSGGHESDMIAGIFDIVRLPPDFPLDWVPEQAN